MGHPPATSQNAKQEGVSYKVARDFSIRPVFRNLFKPLTFSYLVMVKDSIMHFQDVEARVLIDAVAKELASKSEISAPSWSLFVKTGVHKSRVPSRDDWWHVRAAALLRTLALRGPIGIAKLSTKYGGRQRRGHSPPVFKKGSRHIPRTLLQQLEKAGLAKQDVKNGHKGRVATPKGISLLEKTSQKLSKSEGGK